MKLPYIAAAAAFALAISASAANATITIVAGDTPGSLTNVLFDDPESGNSITGFTQPNQGGVGVVFTSTQTLNQNAQGQADITGLFDNISAEALVATDAFLTFQFALTLEAQGDVTITAFDQFGNDFSQTFVDLNANANHRFTVTAIDDQVITRVAVETEENMSRYRQVRIDTTVVPPPNGIPEPFSMSILGIGLLGLAASRRSRRLRNA